MNAGELADKYEEMVAEAKTDKMKHEWSMIAASLRAAASLQAIVNEQAEESGLWCLHPTINEHMLQIALRKLHAAIEELAHKTAEDTKR